MSELTSTLDDHSRGIQDANSRAIQALSEKLQVPERKVSEVYCAEFKRLAAQSRISTFVSVLAMRNTRSLLRQSQAAAAV